MKKKTRFGGHGNPEVIKLDVHQHDGRLINRSKARSNEKEKGVLMKDTVNEFFGLTPEEEKRIREKIRLRYLEDMAPGRIATEAPRWKDLEKDKERAEKFREGRRV